jgi:hypothetical protein
MKNTSLLAELFDKKVLDVILVFLKNRDKDFYLREVAKQSKVPLASTFRIVAKLQQLGFVQPVIISKFKLYRLANNDKTKSLDTLLLGRKTPLDIFVDNASKLTDVKSIILHGEVTRDGANVLIISEGTDSGQLKTLTADIHGKFKFTIKYLVLNEEQFTQMDSMGLYPKRKKVIFSR